MFWPGMVTDCKQFTQTCDSCQRFKKFKRKCGKLPAKKAEVTPWDILCVDMIGPYPVTLKGGKETQLQAMTFIDPATGWFEISEVDNKTSSHLSHLLNRVWLNRYTLPRRIIFDNGTEFKKDFRSICQD